MDTDYATDFRYMYCYWGALADLATGVVPLIRADPSIDLPDATFQPRSDLDAQCQACCRLTRRGSMLMCRRLARAVEGRAGRDPSHWSSSRGGDGRQAMSGDRGRNVDATSVSSRVIWMRVGT